MDGTALATWIESLVGQALGEEESPASARREGTTLYGEPACRGVVSGRCHVVAGDAPPGRVAPGAILVVSRFRPAWAPLLGRLGGLVTEVGSPLADPAILAREYGVPAVVAAHGATTILRSGQWVTLDGASGTVETGAETGGFDGERLTLAMPMSRGSYVAPTAGERVLVSIRVQGGGTPFLDCAVDRRIGGEYPSLVVRVLNVGKQESRRFFRVAPSIVPIDCAVWDRGERGPGDTRDQLTAALVVALASGQAGRIVTLLAAIDAALGQLAASPPTVMDSVDEELLALQDAARAQVTTLPRLRRAPGAGACEVALS